MFDERVALLDVEARNLLPGEAATLDTEYRLSVVGSILLLD